ncbi:MAG: sugar phosphate isomerase/epimerase [Candidatus Aenigmatarchaeota archaeon]
MKTLMSLDPTKSLERQIELAKSIGFDGVEIILEDDAQKEILNEKQREKLKSLIREKKMIVVFHLPNWLDILDEKDKKEIIYFSEIIKKEFNSFCDVHIHAKKSEEVKNFIYVSKEFENSNISFENMFQDIETLTEILDNTKIKITIDISHLLAVNNLQKSFNFLQKYKNRIFHLHFSDGMKNSHSHFALGNGTFPIPKIIRFLKENFEDKTITFEIYDTNIPEIDYEISLNLFKYYYEGK